MGSLGTGHPERVYHKALITGLNSKSIAHRSEVPVPVYFMGEAVGVGYCDLVIDNLIIEIKANRQHPRRAGAQLKKYMRNISLSEKRKCAGVVINFNQRRAVAQVWDIPPLQK